VQLAQQDHKELKDRQVLQDLLVQLDRLELQARRVRRVALDLLVQAGQMQMLYQEY
jgi:hypothetical protein